MDIVVDDDDDRPSGTQGNGHCDIDDEDDLMIYQEALDLSSFNNARGNMQAVIVMD